MEGWCAVDPEIGILTLLLTSPCQPVAFSCRTNRAAPGFCSGVGIWPQILRVQALRRLCILWTCQPRADHPQSVEGRRLSCLLVVRQMLGLLHLYAAACLGSSSSVKYCPTPLPALAVRAFGRHLCKGVVSFCFGSIWQRGIHFWVSTK